MFVVCPQCRAAYQVDAVDEDVIFVCHRCGAEFGFGEPPEDAEPVEERPATDDSLPLFEHAPVPGVTPEPERITEPANPDAAPSVTDTEGDIHEKPLSSEPEPEPEAGSVEADTDRADEPTETTIAETPASDAQHEPETSDQPAPTPSPADTEPVVAETAVAEADIPAPRPPRARVAPWLAAMLLLIAGTGFWTQRDAWLDDPGLRGTMINLGLPLAVRDKDWRIPPASVHAEWVRRDDGSQVMVIEGRVENRLDCELPPPFIHVTIYDKRQPDHVLAERTLPITQPPLMATIRHAPFAPPPTDALPVAALGGRGFVLVLDDLPEHAGTFTLSPVARRS